MKTLREAFTPNHSVDAWTKRFCLMLFCGALIALWAILPSRIIPTPWAIVAAFPRLWSQEGLGQELWTSLELILESTAVMVVASLLIAYGTRLPALRPIATVVSFGRFNSFVGLPLLLTILIGDAHVIKVILLSLAMTVFSVPAIVDVINTIPKESFEDARTLRMSEWRIMWEVVILGKFHEVIDVLRTNWSMGWMLLPMVEGIFRSEGGIGVLLLVENKYLRLDSVYCIILFVGLVGIAGDRMILWFKKSLCPYAFIDTERA